MLLAMFGIGTTEIVIFVVIAVLLFGPSQIPKLFKSFGQSIREFRKAGDELTCMEEDLRQDTHIIQKELNK